MAPPIFSTPMLIFSRSGNAARRSPELIASLLERTMALVRTHPDAQGVVLSAEYGDPVETGASVDARQISVPSTTCF